MLVQGVRTTVVHDVVHLDGQLLEDTYDWYAQDKDGNVWYFGEDTKEYSGSKVDTSGSWQAGVHGPGRDRHEGHPMSATATSKSGTRARRWTRATCSPSTRPATVPYGHLTVC